MIHRIADELPSMYKERASYVTAEGIEWLTLIFVFSALRDSFREEFNRKL